MRRKTLLFLFLLFFYLHTTFFLPATTHASSVEAYDEDPLRVRSKFEPWLWDKIQALKFNGTTRNLSLIIRLHRDHADDKEMEDLKNYATSLFTSSHNATVYSVLRVLPVVMAKVPVAEAERIASYQFVASIGDGEKTGFVCLDVSRPAIGADKIETVLGYRGDGIKIAILDSGINSSHPDLNDLDDDPNTFDPKVIVERSYVDRNDDGEPDEDTMDYLGHGTLVAGIAAGTGEASNYQYVGVAPRAWLMNIKVVYFTSWAIPVGRFEWDDVINGIEYAISQGADVINLSLVDPDAVIDGTNELAKAADDAVEKGVVVIVGAGNDGPDRIGAPADAFNVITVGAVDDGNSTDIKDDTFATFSSRGPTADGRPKPDVVAPGINIVSPISRDSAYWQADPSARKGDFYYEVYGTSYAAPHVSGTVALMLEANPNLTPAQVKAILRQRAKLNTHLSGLTKNDRGYGIIDAYDAVQLAQNVSNINRELMYDSWWEVSTPPRQDISGKFGEYLNFSVMWPLFHFGIQVIDVHYYSWDWWGSTSTNYKLLSEISARHVWIDDTYYDLGNDMNRYLFSGPRIYEKGGGYVLMRAKYKVNNVFVEYLWKIHVDEMWLKLNFVGGSSWSMLEYIDVDVWDSTNWAYLPTVDDTLLTERKIYGYGPLDIRDLDHAEYVQIVPSTTDNPVTWVLKHDYFGNDPDSALKGKFIYNRDIAIHYQATSYSPDPGPTIYRRTNPSATPDPTQNDAFSGGDAGNNFTTATPIDIDMPYSGILCYSDPEDTDDWYQFYAESGKNIHATMSPPSDIDFDLQLYDPRGTLRDESHFGPGEKESIVYTTDRSGYWRIRIYIVTGEAEYTFSVTNPSSGGSGDPPNVPDSGDPAPN